MYEEAAYLWTKISQKVCTLFNFEADNNGCGLTFRRKKYIKSKLVGFTISKSFSILRAIYFHFIRIVELEIPKHSSTPSLLIECSTDPFRINPIHYQNASFNSNHIYNNAEASQTIQNTKTKFKKVFYFYKYFSFHYMSTYIM